MEREMYVQLVLATTLNTLHYFVTPNFPGKSHFVLSVFLHPEHTYSNTVMSPHSANPGWKRCQDEIVPSAHFHTFPLCRLSVVKHVQRMSKLNPRPAGNAPNPWTESRKGLKWIQAGHKLPRPCGHCSSGRWVSHLLIFSAQNFSSFVWMDSQLFLN